MKRKIILPNNGFGLAIMILLPLLVIVAPYVVAFWLISLVAPWWVAIPLGLVATIVSFLTVVRFKS